MSNERNAPNPVFVSIIERGVMDLIKNNESMEFNIPDVLYTATSTTIKRVLQGMQTIDRPSTIFAYYFATYKLLASNEVNKDLPIYHPKDPSQNFDAYELDIGNKAALSLFDIYPAYKKDNIFRSVLKYATKALLEVYTSATASSVNKIHKGAIANSVNLGLISETFAFYLKGDRRDKNVGYVQWVGRYIAHLFDTLGTDDMVDLPQQKDIFIALRQRQPVIIVSKQ